MNIKSHFAELDENKKVKRVCVVDNSSCSFRHADTETLIVLTFNENMINKHHTITSLENNFRK